MEKKYLSDLLASNICGWWHKKVILLAPTGLGKTTFIVKTFREFFETWRDAYGMGQKKKILILCNRKLLRKQYLYSILGYFETYSSLKDTVAVQTYQDLAESIRNCATVDHIWKEYEAVICDEAHYFLADSDFNGFGTYVLLNAIVRAGASKTIIFMTATGDEVNPIIRSAINAQKRLVQSIDEHYESKWFEIIEENFSFLVDYSHIRCVSIPDIESLCSRAALGEGKILIFIDDKTMASEMADQIKKIGELENHDVAVLHAENLDKRDMRGVVEPLAITGKIVPKVLITTSVLDNGISVQDPEITAVAVITESRISFLQMIGRVRTESIRHEIDLVFLERPADFFRKRQEQYEKQVSDYENAISGRTGPTNLRILSSVWENISEVAESYRKVFIPVHKELDYIPEYYKKYDSYYGIGLLGSGRNFGEAQFVINHYGREKVGDLYKVECEFYHLALQDPLNVIYRQMEWLGKTPDELICEESDYLAKMVEDFKARCLSIQKFSYSDFSNIKAELNNLFRKKLFPEISKKNGPIGNDKFDEVLAKYGLKLLVNTVDKVNTYSVISEEGS